jgi:flagellar basal body-associated protein FliL
MAEEHKPPAAPPADAAAPRKSGRGKILIVIAAVMLVEGGVIFAIAHFLRPEPAPAAAAEQHGMEGESAMPAIDYSEIEIAPIDAINTRDGRAFLYHLEVSALVRLMHKDTCKGLIDARKATIRDRLDTLLRNADPKYLNEPGLETLRRQIKFELDKVFKDEKLVDEILITKFLKSRANL